ncbi:DUF732 domain-containing protein [Chlorogloea sp. CCALA 695]|uniref:DUF732 domain-containing protein n=1 Tax=Chlorogloea sp. CCALA 695 TaxID=2107693 RepID=UPI000D0813DA|nr:DUF732 domain-containing protein [Chlorogloea sp. CCALA 695]PSB32537.1 hypothetical protein C7B70_09885 [Chlorogloea sp. CCALA 695]
MVTGIKKLFCLSAVVVCVALDSTRTAEVAFGLSVNKSSEYPIVSSLDIGKPICYIQESNGSTLDLSNLCSDRQTKTQLSKLDRDFLDSYNNSLEIYQNERTLVSPDTDEAPNPIAVARGVCSALQSKVPLEQIKTEQYEKIIETKDPRNQKTALAESDIIDSLAIKFYCPKFAQ